MKSIRENKMSEHKDNHKFEIEFGYDTRRISDDILGLKK